MPLMFALNYAINNEHKLSHKQCFKFILQVNISLDYNSGEIIVHKLTVSHAWFAYSLHEVFLCMCFWEVSH